MSRFTLSILLIFFISYTNAQIGININTPSGAFHVRGSTYPTESNSLEKDVIIDTKGNISIGAGDTPNPKLHIKTTEEGKA